MSGAMPSAPKPTNTKPANALKEPLNPEPKTPTAPESGSDKCKKKVMHACGGVCGGCFVLVWILQGFIYWWATIGCSARTLKGYHYYGGGTTAYGGATDNLVPRISLLAERDPSMWGESFSNIPSNEASSLADAPTGTWWKNWGPFFDTYTYEDSANSKMTIYMRRNMLRLGMSHRIARCDGEGPYITVAEGSNWFGNKMRALFGTTMGAELKIWSDDTEMAIAIESTKGAESISTRSMNGTLVGSSIHQDSHFHGQYDLWLVKNEQENDVLPAWAQNGISVLFAFHVAGQKQVIPTTTAPKYGSHGNNPSFLVAENKTITEGTVEMAAAVPEVKAAESASKDVEVAAVPEAKAAEPASQDAAVKQSLPNQPEETVAQPASDVTKAQLV